jgi:CheY-like chemotaxis protein
MESKEHTILIVDDVITNLDLLKGLLADSYNVKVANNGATALKIARMSLKPDLILLDIMMPEMDGFQVCRELKSDPSTSDIPIIFLTAKTETEDIVAGFETGGVDYVTKPFNPPELLARVSTQILIKKQRDLILKKNQEQKELLHILSHDLANHFGVIIFALDLMKMMPEKTAEYIEKIKSATKHGVDIIDLVREMRALQEKSVQVFPVTMSEIVRESLLLIGDRYEQKNVRLIVDVAENLRVIAEKRSLVNSVLNNLLTNALKFSFEGERVEIVAKEEDGTILLMVEDHGIGMPANMLEHIYDMTKNNSRPGTNDEPGTGFGMSLIKSFVDSYGGRIEILSRDIQEYPQDHGTKVMIHFQKAVNDYQE